MKKIALLSVLVIWLAGCYQTAQTRVNLGDLGYQFMEPEGLCRKRALPEGIALYCPEGRITVNLPRASEAGSLDEVLAAALGADADQYTVAEWEALGPTLTVYTLPLEAHIGREHLPKYVAAAPFGPDRLALLEGELYTGAFEADFERAFRTVATTLQPFQPGQETETGE